jgi:cytochrome c-type biogenesis protein CcmH/NrfG
MLEDQQLDNVQKVAEGILKVYPDHVETLSNFAVSYFYRNEYDKALALLHKAEKLAPTDVVVLTNIAYAYRQKQDTANAIKYFEKVIEFGDEADKEYAKDQIRQLRNQK